MFHKNGLDGKLKSLLRSIIIYFIGLSFAVCAGEASSPAHFGAEGNSPLSVLVKAQQLLDSGSPAQAYELLVAIQGERAGEPAFDYLLGKAALGAGHRTEAMFALERVVDVQPDNQKARLEIAKTLFELNEWENAKKELETIKRQNIPAELQATVDRYLEAIAWRTSDAYSPFWSSSWQKDMNRYLDETDRAGALAAKRTKVWGFSETFAGYNSNINSGTNQGSMAIPAFGGTIVRLAPGSAQAGSGAGGFAAGIAFDHPLIANWSLIGGATGRDKETGNRFNTTAFNGYGGLQLVQDRHVFTVSGEAEHFMVDKDSYRNLFGGIAQWSYLLNDTSRATLYFRGSKLEYPGQNILDSDRYVSGLRYSKALTGSWAPLLFAEVYGGTQQENARNVPHLGYDLYGVRLGGTVALTESISMFASGNAEFRRYDGAEPLFLKTRADNQGDVSLGMEYRPAQYWRIAPRVMYTKSASNIKLFDYDRIEYTVTLRRDF